ncbi:MAG: hypothetical protein J0M08_03690 [Bacteroidetes bacterium]|nr:hypothetical protein [Bacteroidota bacterium]
MFNDLRKVKFYEFILLFIYLVLSIALFPILSYYVDNSDTLQYLTIAQKYVEGDFYNALNGFWGPLTSWLLVPFLWIGADPIFSFRVLQITIGMFILHYSFFFIEKQQINEWLRKGLKMAFVPIILSYVFSTMTADLTMLLFLLVYLKMCVVDSNNPFVFGVVGALLYFSKSFGLPFFLVHFTAFQFFSFFKKAEFIARKAVVKKYFFAVFVFSIISGAWILLLSFKYNKLTISYSATYNLSPEIVTNIKGKEYHHPFTERGLLLPPSNETAVCAWEDPASIKVAGFDAFSSKAAFKNYFLVVKRNFLSIYYNDFKRQIGMISIVSLFVFFLFIKKPFSKIGFLVGGTLFTIALFYCGYGLVIIEPRYLWINNLLLIVVTTYFISEIIRVSKLGKFIGIIIFCLMLFVVIKRPIKQLIFIEDTSVSLEEFSETIKSPILKLQETYQADKNLFQLIDTLKKRPDLKGRVASQKLSKKRNQYASTALISFYLSNPYYGQLSSDFSTAQNTIQLKEYGIDYYYVWDKNSNSNILNNTTVLFYDRATGLEIHSLNSLDAK